MFSSLVVLGLFVCFPDYYFDKGIYENRIIIFYYYDFIYFNYYKKDICRCCFSFFFLSYCVNIKGIVFNLQLRIL